ncbi:MAG TPA: tetratricopeptide repeat protein [Vicinamibacterales bacterium]|nr:tetratricopeptide repeat protein [Vicinamibacterales bacterium]
MTRRLGSRLALAAAAAALVAGCSTHRPPAPPAPAAPRYPDYPTPDVPATLRVTPEIRATQDRAWALLQGGDARGADAAFTALVKQAPAFYPAEAGLGFAQLALRQYKTAAAHFGAVLAKNDKYVPAWQGQADAQLAQGDEAGAIASLDRVLALDPKNDVVRSRLDLLRFRQVQALIDAGRTAREAGRLEAAQADFEQALALSPSSAVIFREMAVVETARGALDQAETHARRATQLDAGDADAFATLGAALEARGKLREAAAAFAQAARIDPRPAWKTRAEALSDKADMAAVPAEFRSMGTAPSVTRAQLAALVGIRLESVLDRAQQRVQTVATDVRGHWAEPWILPVTQTGVMDVFPNHTFQPSSTVRRSDLAKVVSQLLTLIASERQIDLPKWKAARPAFPDLPASNVYYPSAALAVACGAMAPMDDNKFGPTQVATGASVVAAVARLQQIAGRQQP